jgi:hypothetical protein
VVPSTLDDIDDGLVEPDGFRLPCFLLDEFQRSTFQVELIVSKGQEIADAKREVQTDFPDIGIEWAITLIKKRRDQTDLILADSIDGVHFGEPDLNNKSSL